MEKKMLIMEIEKMLNSTSDMKLIRSIYLILLKSGKHTNN